MRKLRLSRGLNVDQLANKLGIDRTEITAIERNSCHRISPFVLYKLSKFYNVSQKKLSELAGFIKIQDEVRDHASRFAAQSDSFALLTPEERRQLDEFVTFLREET
ncbi:MAG: helix-turn-helix domain-containing protein [Deltaproteobacteria bacterium]